MLSSRIVTREKQIGHAFISYVRKDTKKTVKLVEELEANGIEVWIDKRKLRPGTRWQRAIRQAILEGTCFTPASRIITGTEI